MKERDEIITEKKGQDEEKMRWNETSADLSEFRAAAAEYKESNEKLSTGKIQDCLIELDHYSKHK